MSEEHHDDSFYIKIWGILVVLLIVSVLGPMLEIQWVTLITAFGIACVKAYMVAKNFMHLNLTPKFVTYLMVTCLVFMLLFYAGTAPDVLRSEGQNWVKEDHAWQWETHNPSPALQHAAGEHGSDHH